MIKMIRFILGVLLLIILFEYDPYPTCYDSCTELLGDISYISGSILFISISVIICITFSRRVLMKQLLTFLILVVLTSMHFLVNYSLAVEIWLGITLEHRLLVLALIVVMMISIFIKNRRFLIPIYILLALFPIILPFFIYSRELTVLRIKHYSLMGVITTLVFATLYYLNSLSKTDHVAF